MGQEHTLSSCAHSKVADFGVNDEDTCVPGVGPAAQPKSTQVTVSRARESVIELNVFTLEGRGSSNQCHRNQKAFTDSAGKQLYRPAWLSQDTNENSSQFLNHAQILTPLCSRLSKATHDSFGFRNRLTFLYGQSNNSVTELSPLFPTHYRVTTRERPVLRTEPSHKARHTNSVLRAQ